MFFFFRFGSDNSLSGRQELPGDDFLDEAVSPDGVHPLMEDSADADPPAEPAEDHAMARQAVDPFAEVAMGGHDAEAPRGSKGGKSSFPGSTPKIQVLSLQFLSISAFPTVSLAVTCSNSVALLIPCWPFSA